MRRALPFYVLLLTFILLQAMDALTTLVFLRMGIGEGNPLIRMVLGAAAAARMGTLPALALPKLFAVALGIFAWRSGRKRLLLKMDLLFATCVAWNLIAIFSRC